MFYLYKITNLINNKVYIGQSNKENERWRQHKYFAKNPEKTGQYIHQAMAKYGVDNFTYEVIAVSITQEDANEIEKQLIIQYDSRNSLRGYNVSPGGDAAWNRGLPKELHPMYGRHHSEETKIKISISNTGVPRPPHTEEWKKKKSDSMVGHKVSEETKSKIRSKAIGRKHSDETKRKMSTITSSKTGENASRSKITWDVARAIRKEYDEGNTSQAALARKYNLKPPTIRSIINNETWKE